MCKILHGYIFTQKEVIKIHFKVHVIITTYGNKGEEMTALKTSILMYKMSESTFMLKMTR